MCVKCSKGYYLDSVTTSCQKAEHPIADCVDMVKIDDTIYCNVCEKGFPSEEYAFTACSKFSTNEVVGSETTTFTKPPKGYLEYLATMESYLNKWGLVTPRYIPVKPTFACEWGAINSYSIDVCARCMQGYTIQNGRCVLSKSLGCLHYNEKQEKCWFCDVFNGYYSTWFGKECSKFKESSE